MPSIRAPDVTRDTTGPPLLLSDASYLQRLVLYWYPCLILHQYPCLFLYQPSHRSYLFLY